MSSGDLSWPCLLASAARLTRVKPSEPLSLAASKINVLLCIPEPLQIVGIVHAESSTTMASMQTSIGRPEPAELAEYQQVYLQKISGDDILSVLEQQLHAMSAMFHGIAEAKGTFRYAPGKWTVKELIGHVTDTERVFAYRALVFARNDGAVLPGFDQDPWVEHAPHGQVPIQELVQEFEAVRGSTIHLFRYLDPEAWMRWGTANNRRITVRAQAYVIAGHVQHHFEILKSRYGM